jgi:hypothetical protein
MSDRADTGFSKLRGATLPEGLWERSQAGPRLAALPPREPARRFAGIVALAVVVTIIALLWPLVRRDRSGTPLQGPETVTVPPRGDASPVFAPDGRPVFVVHHDDGTVSVLDAFSSHHPWGFDDLVAWCPRGGTFFEWAHGVHFDEFGAYLLGPAPTGLVPFDFEVVSEDDTGDPATIRIGGPLAPDPRGSPHEAEGNYEPCIEAVGAPGPLVGHTFGPDQIYDAPDAAVAASPEGYVAVRGTLLIETPSTGATLDQPWAQLCASVEDGVCVDGVPVLNIDALGLLTNVLMPAPGSAYEKREVWLTRVQGDALLGLGIVPPDQVVETSSPAT